MLKICSVGCGCWFLVVRYQLSGIGCICRLAASAVANFFYCRSPVAKFRVPDWGDKIACGIGLSYRPAGLHRLADRYDNPMPESILSPRLGTMNFATALLLPQLNLSVDLSASSPAAPRPRGLQRPDGMRIIHICDHAKLLKKQSNRHFAQEYPWTN